MQLKYLQSNTRWPIEHCSIARWQCLLTGLCSRYQMALVEFNIGYEDVLLNIIKNMKKSNIARTSTRNCMTRASNYTQACIHTVLTTVFQPCRGYCWWSPKFTQGRLFHCWSAILNDGMPFKALKTSRCDLCRHDTVCDSLSLRRPTHDCADTSFTLNRTSTALITARGLSRKVRIFARVSWRNAQQHGVILVLFYVN